MASASASASAPSGAPAVPEVAVAGEVNRMIQSEVSGVYARLERLRQAAKFPSFAPVNVPMVLVLGNHSSGKSTFINYMLQQEVQKTGRAPTDCTFTVLVGGPRAERLDGAALVRHAQYGFDDVPRLFGRELVSQIELKVIEKSPLLDHGGLMLVDSPGMIDPPGASPDRTDNDRGYDFKRVVQWLADRADVILVMFDPDKPGTTFETLDVLTSSLRELSSKVLLILNKVDDFRTVHDFARAYGALCWNLSKVIPRKDLPFIYTMYVPQDQREGPSNDHEANKVSSKRRAQQQHKPSSNSSNGPTPVATEGDDVAVATEPPINGPRGVQKMLEHEFDGTRGEVVREVERAPDRATDNVLNLLKSTASRLKMHVKMVEACKKEYVDLETFWRRVQIAGIAAGVGVVAFYLIRTVGRAPPIDPNLLTGTDNASASASAATTTSAPAAGTPTMASSSPSSGATPARVATPSHVGGAGGSSSSTTSSSATPKHGNLRGSQEWKQNWAKQVARSHSPFKYATFFKLIVSTCAANFAIWKTALLRLERKREGILEWLPLTFERVYAKYLCKSDRTHDEIVSQWKVVRPGLEVALQAAPITVFSEFELEDKSYLDDVLALHIPRLDRCVRDRTGDDHAYLRFKHLEKPSAKTN